MTYNGCYPAIKDLPATKIFLGANGIGTVIFGEGSIMYGNTGIEAFVNGRVMRAFAFLDIRNAGTVYDLVIRIKDNLEAGVWLYYMIKSVCVYCSSSDAVSPEFFNAATSLGCAIVSSGWSLVYGGGNIGLMGAVAKSVTDCGGEVIGVIPEFMQARGLAYCECSELIITNSMRERKAAMEERADAFIALPGGFGTLEEVFEILTFKQLGLHGKPLVLLNTDNFYDGLNNLLELMFAEHFAKPAYRELYHFSSSVEDAVSYIQTYKPHELEVKWYRQ